MMSRPLKDKPNVVSRQGMPKEPATKSPTAQNAKSALDRPASNTAAEKSKKLAFRRYIYKKYTRPTKVEPSSPAVAQSANGGVDSASEETDPSEEILYSQKAERKRIQIFVHLTSLLYDCNHCYLTDCLNFVTSFPNINARTVNKEGIRMLTIITGPSKMLPLILHEMRSDPVLSIFNELFDIFIGTDIDLEPETIHVLFPELPVWVDYLLGNAFKETVEQIHPHLKSEWIFHCHNKLCECFSRLVEDGNVIHSKSIGYCEIEDDVNGGLAADRVFGWDFPTDLIFRGEPRWTEGIDFPFLVIESLPKGGLQSSLGSHKVTMLLAKAYQHQVDLLSQVDISKVDPIVCMPLVFGLCLDGRQVKVSLYRVINGVQKNCYCFPPLDVIKDMKRILRIFACIKTTALAMKKSFDLLDLL